MPENKDPSVENIRTNLRLTIASLYASFNGADAVTDTDDLGAFYQASVEIFEIAMILQDAVDESALKGKLPQAAGAQKCSSLVLPRNVAPITLRAITPSMEVTKVENEQARRMNVPELLSLGKARMRALYAMSLVEQNLDAEDASQALTTWETLNDMEQAAKLWTLYNEAIPLVAQG